MYIFDRPSSAIIIVVRIPSQGAVIMINPPGRGRSGPRSGTRLRIGRPRNDEEKFRFSQNPKFPGSSIPRKLSTWNSDPTENS